MNIQEYISSGIVEAYVLGLAEPAERDEFERMCAQYPEVREAREAFEISLEQYAMLNQVQPSPNLKSRIFAAIDINAVQPGGTGTAGNAFAPSSSFDGQAEPWKARVVGMAGWQRYLAAACIALLVVSTALNFYFFSQSRKYSQAYTDLLAQQTATASNNQVLQARMLEYERAMQWMKDPNMAIVKMPAIPNSPDPNSVTTVYWDTLTRDVYLAVNQLPQPAADQQYQLWALVDGKPVDAGVIELGTSTGVTKMKNIPRADAFAITLEKRGGSLTPSLDKLYVMGKV